MIKIGLDVPGPESPIPRDARRIAQEIGAFPLIIRPAFTLGGTGAASRTTREYESIVARGLDLPRKRGPHRGVAAGLEGIRDGGHAGPQ